MSILARILEDQRKLKKEVKNLKNRLRYTKNKLTEKENKLKLEVIKNKELRQNLDECIRLFGVVSLENARLKKTSQVN